MAETDLDKRLKDMRAEMEAKFAADLETERTKVTLAATEAEKARTEMAAKLLATEQANLAQTERMKALEAENAIARVRAIRHDAEQFVAEHSTAQCLKIPPTARRIAVALLSSLPSDGVAMSAEAGSELQVFSEGETPAPLSAAALFQRYVEKCPDGKVWLAEVTHAKPTGSAPETYSEAEAVVASREKLELSVPENRAKVAAIVQREFPQIVAAECAPRKRA